MKNPFAKKLLAVLILFATTPAWALTYEEALKHALAHSPEIKELQLQAESARWAQIKAYSGYLPKLQLQGRHLFDERFEELEVPFNGEVFVMPAIQPYSSLGVYATMNIFDGFQTTQSARAASLQKDAAQLRLNRMQEQKRAEIRTLFYNALGSQILVDVADQNIQTLQSHLNEVTSRVRSGVSTKYDSLRVEVQLEDARTEKVAAENNVAVARAKLFEAMGLADDGQPLSGTLPENFTQLNPMKLTLKEAQRTDRAALVAEEERAHDLAKASYAHWLPKVSLFGNYEWYNNINHSVTEDDERFKSAYALGVLFSWNLFDGGAEYAEQRQAALAQEIASVQLAKFDQNAPVELEEVKRRLSYDITNYKAKLVSIRKAEEAVRLARGGLRAGTRTNTEVLDAVVDLNRAKAAAVRSQMDAIEALGKLELALGHTVDQG